MIEKLEGIVLSCKDYSETSKLLSIITKKYGIISVIAKGARNLKSDLRSSSDKLTYGYFNVYYKENKLSILSSVDIIDNFKNIKKDIEKISYASYILDLTGQVIKQTNKDIFDLLINSLIKINTMYDPMVIMNILEFKYLDLLGVCPVIDCCSKCGNTTSIATISVRSAGYVCNKCLKNEKIYSDKTIKLIRMFYYLDISKITKLQISEEVKNEINSFISEYYKEYTGIYLKSKEFIDNLNKLNV